MELESYLSPCTRSVLNIVKPGVLGLQSLEDEAGSRLNTGVSNDRVDSSVSENEARRGNRQSSEEAV